MRLARPSTLWRAVSFDLWKLLLLTAAVVVSVGVFAISLRPLAEGKIGPEDAIRFMLFGLLPMLQYALPFAAGFAATLVYHRLAGDNELVAAHAGGISHRTLLAPAGLAGLILSGLLFFLADAAIPRLLRAMEEILTQDAVRLLITPIKRGESIQFGPRVQVYADDVASPPPAAGDQAAERYVLSGVVAIELDETGRVIREASARTAYVWIHRAGGIGAGTADAQAPAPASTASPSSSGTTVVLRLQDATSQERDPGLRAADDTTIVYRVPNFFSDDPKFLTWSQLRRATRHPEMMNWIDRQRQTVAALLDERAVVEALSGTLARDGRVRFTDPAGREITVKAARLGELVAGKGWSIEPAPNGTNPSQIEVVTVLAEGRARVQRARRAYLSAPADESSPPGTVHIRLEAVSTGAMSAMPNASEPSTVMDSASGQIKEWSLAGLVPTSVSLPNSERSSVTDLIARATAAAAPGSRLAEATTNLSRQTRNLEREILSKQHERLAAAAACLVMVLCGSVMAMRLRDSLPLAVYLWSFLPALGTLLSISGGQRLTHQLGAPGLTLLWGGVAGLALFTLAEYRRLCRH